MTKVEEEARYLRTAIELALRGARPNVICALTKLRQDRVADIYQDINGSRPPKGRTPEQLDSFLRSKPINLACTFFYLKFYRALRYGLDQATSMIIAYDLTADNFNVDGKPVISFDRGFNIVQAITYQQSHYLTKCAHCFSKYLVLKAQLKNDTKFCPVCVLLKNTNVEESIELIIWQPSLPFEINSL